MTEIKPIRKCGGGIRFIFTAFSQYFAYPSMGCKVVAHSLHPDAPGDSAATFGVVPADGQDEVPVQYKDALQVLSRMSWAIGTGQAISVEHLPVQGDEEYRYAITIKKTKTGGEL